MSGQITSVLNCGDSLGNGLLPFDKNSEDTIPPLTKVEIVIVKDR